MFWKKKKEEIKETPWSYKKSYICEACQYDFCVLPECCSECGSRSFSEVIGRRIVKITPRDSYYSMPPIIKRVRFEVAETLVSGIKKE